jgi:hypothetical protein
MIKLPLFIFSWILFFIFNTLTIIVGWILIPLMALLWKYTTKTETSIINGKQILNWKHRFMWLYSNQEDGIMGASEYKDRSNFIRIVYWSALRNPSNNMRFIKALTCQLNPKEIKFRGTHPKDINGTKYQIMLENNKDLLYTYDSDMFRFISLTWQGMYSNLRIQFKMFDKIWRFWIGWKIYPHDTLGISPNDYRRYGAGFAMQFKKIYPRENK